MKTTFTIFAALILTCITAARAQDQVPEKPGQQDQKHVQTTTIQENEAGTRAMKINQEEPTESERREVFLDELRKLYKANFL